MAIFQQLTDFFDRLTQPAPTWPAVNIRLPGRRSLHLVGSIHMGTPNMAPLPARLMAELKKADALIVEADIRTDTSPFSDIPTTSPLDQRLSPSLCQQVSEQCRRLGINLAVLDTQPLWQIALMLQANQASQLGLRAEYGIDYQLLEAAQTLNMPIKELEGTANQVSLLTTLPDEGLALLEDTLHNWHTNARLLQIMTDWWLGNTPDQRELQLPSTFSHIMHDVLIDRRNQQWCHCLQQLPAGQYVVAVGAFHLFGEGSLPARLTSP